MSKLISSPPPPPRTNAPAGSKIMLGWDLPQDDSVTGLIIYAASNSAGPWRIVARAGLTNRAIVTNIFAPQYFYAASTNAANTESVPSNRLGVLGRDRIIEVRGCDESSADLKTWTSTNRVVVCVTNPPGAQFFRTQPLTISTRQQWRTESLP
ncbi:MAG: hypothetical protein HC901_00275 [Bdellovibrionaceae bacterium]|nr:hypothetical protein [Pseudobdellovibrionaceae bacterium]